MEISEIMTDRDIACRTVAEGRNPLEMNAEEVMSQGPAGIVSLADIALHTGGKETAEVVGEVSQPNGDR